MTQTIPNLKEKYMAIYDDSAVLFKEACLAQQPQRINQNLAIMNYLDRVLAELGET